MSKLQPDAAPGRLVFMCPGCEMPHAIGYSGAGPLWMWNGSHERPTFSPSVAVSWSEPSDVPEEFDDSSKDIQRVCHSFVTDGRIQFLGDCTHKLVGQTVDIPDWSDT